MSMASSPSDLWSSVVWLLDDPEKAKPKTTACRPTKQPQGGSLFSQLAQRLADGMVDHLYGPTDYQEEEDMENDAFLVQAQKHIKRKQDQEEEDYSIYSNSQSMTQFERQLQASIDRNFSHDVEGYRPSRVSKNNTTVPAEERWPSIARVPSEEENESIDTGDDTSSMLQSIMSSLNLSVIQGEDGEEDSQSRISMTSAMILQDLLMEASLRRSKKGISTKKKDAKNLSHVAEEILKVDASRDDETATLELDVSAGDDILAQENQESSLSVDLMTDEQLQVLENLVDTFLSSKLERYQEIKQQQVQSTSDQERLVDQRATNSAAETSLGDTSLSSQESQPPPSTPPLRKTKIFIDSTAESTKSPENTESTLEKHEHSPGIDDTISTSAESNLLVAAPQPSIVSVDNGEMGSLLGIESIPKEDEQGPATPPLERIRNVIAEKRRNRLERMARLAELHEQKLQESAASAEAKRVVNDDESLAAENNDSASSMRSQDILSAVFPPPSPQASPIRPAAIESVSVNDSTGDNKDEFFMQSDWQPFGQDESSPFAAHDVSKREDAGWVDFADDASGSLWSQQLPKASPTSVVQMEPELQGRKKKTQPPSLLSNVLLGSDAVDEEDEDRVLLFFADEGSNTSSPTSQNHFKVTRFEI